MGEAKRRRERERASNAVREAEARRWIAEREEFELLLSEDPDDRAIREAHGFSYEDGWQDPELLCRNGCGLPYGEVVAGKVRICNRQVSGAEGGPGGERSA